MPITSCGSKGMGTQEQQLRGMHTCMTRSLQNGRSGKYGLHGLLRNRTGRVSCMDPGLWEVRTSHMLTCLREQSQTHCVYESVVHCLVWVEVSGSCKVTHDLLVFLLRAAGKVLGLEGKARRETGTQGFGGLTRKRKGRSASCCQELGGSTGQMRMGPGLRLDEKQEVRLQVRTFRDSVSLPPNVGAPPLPHPHRRVPLQSS